MSFNRRDRIEDLFHKASGLSGNDRDSFLESECGDDPGLLEEVSDLLSRDRGTDELAVAPPFDSLNADRSDSAARSPSTGGVRPREDPTATEAPKNVGTYSIRGELGRGGMGVVYSAHDPSLGRTVAIKVLPNPMAGSAERRARFEREARLLAATNHPNIATIYSLEADGDLKFLTMEEVPGSSLRQRLAHSRLSIDDALHLARQVAGAIEAAHEREIVHRDLKPSNIMITPTDVVKVLDFGIAASGRSEVESGEPFSGLDDFAGGTPGYMSPEQIRGESSDPRTDVFAFGCVLYECLVGRPAFVGSTSATRLRANSDARLEMETLPDETPDPVRELVASCLEPEAADRLSTMAEARRILESTIEDRKFQHLLRQRDRRPEDRPHNLPRQLNRFVGRRAEISDLRERLRSSRLTTLTGVGGCGKTRLAMEFAADEHATYEDGTWLVGLAALADPSQVPSALIQVLGIRETPGRDNRELIVDGLAGKSMLLIFDNCEHLLEPVSELIEIILQASDGIRVLATSREALGLYGESVYPVPTLRPPPQEAELCETIVKSEAVQLFVDRARSVDPDFEVNEDNAAPVAEICRRLDGIPLALEMAAARARAWTVSDIAASLDQKFRVLTRGARSALPRHQTLRGLIDWSYEQLTEKESTVLRRLSTFAGGWELGAVEPVCAGGDVEPWEVMDVFVRLIDKSLVERDAEKSTRSGRTRYRMLETVRDYARGKLDQDPADRAATQSRHLDLFLASAETAGVEMRSPKQFEVLAQMDADYENYRWAMVAGLEEDPPGAGSVGDSAAEARKRLVLALKLYPYWTVRGLITEGRTTCERLLRQLSVAERSLNRSRVLLVAAAMAFHCRDFEAAQRDAAESLSIAREHQDRNGISNASTILGCLAENDGELEVGRSFHEESLANSRELGVQANVASSLNNLSSLAVAQGDLPAARRFIEECLSIRRELEDPWAIETCLSNFANLAYQEGNFEEARNYCEESLAIQTRIERKQGLAHSHFVLGNLDLLQGHFDEAAEHYEQSVTMRREHGDTPGVAEALHGLGTVAVRRSDARAAKVCYEESLALRKKLGTAQGIVQGLAGSAFLACQTGRHAEAARFVGAIEALVDGARVRILPVERQLLDETVPLLREALGDHGFLTQTAEGQAMATEDILEQALAAMNS